MSLVSYSHDALKQLKLIKKSGDKALMAKIQALSIELSEHPETGKGRPEQLKHDLSGLWSRRLDKKNRIIYKIDEDSAMAHIVGVIGHYSDK